MNETGFNTSLTLLERVKDMSDQEAWDRFYRLYSPLVIAFCLKKGCKRESANDILQDSMVSVMSALPRFEHGNNKGMFRSFLLKIVNRRIADTFRHAKRSLPEAPEMETGEIQRIEDPSAAPNSREWDRLWKHNLFHHALKRIESKVTPVTFQSFKLYVLEKVKAEDVAQRLNLTKNTVFQHKNRVTKLLQQEIDALKQEIGD